MEFQRNIAQRGDALELLQSLPQDCGALGFFDPQYRGILNEMAFGNEGARQSGRVDLPQMTGDFIDACCREMARVLRPGGYTASSEATATPPSDHRPIDSDTAIPANSSPPTGDKIVGFDVVGERVILGLNASPEALDRIGRGEIDWHDHNPRYFDRNRNEDPEQSFRRGMQQGAHRVYHALEEAGVLDAATLKRIRHYYGIELFDWRYAKRRRLGRRLNTDSAPWLDLTKGNRGRR